ncbi:MAG TPA: DUF1559 domain-containing protein [Gemmataceae bacterium]|jgi:hypothetical protein|nr:DUF1559 domain-containing protein [Gemmataceae bacterium]
MNRLLAAATMMGMLASTACAAPAPKEKAPEPDGPITPEMLRKSSNNLKQFALAFHNFSDANKELPANQMSKDGKPLLSWRVQILPYIEQDELYKQFKLDEPWDSPNNKKLIDKIPAIYVPLRGKAEKGQTFYQVFGGKHGLFPPGFKYSLATIPDGTSNTFMIAEAGKPVIWTKPDDMVFDGKTVPELGGMFDGKFHAAMGDGSVMRFRKNADQDTLKMLIDPADGAVLPRDLGLDKDEK